MAKAAAPSPCRLARAASKMGKKAIIVDCAPQRLASRAIKAQVKTGLYDVLTGTVPLNQALAKDPRGETYVLATPKRPQAMPSPCSSRAPWRGWCRCCAAAPISW